ncbi:MAG: DUF4190 domain-containing protein [Flavobacteriaceae bacterium]|nr:DUF4190 domain-containing protein [Flavobacteriaceae bacterium]
MDKEKLPHSQSALTLGIISIFTACCCFSLIGIIIGLIGLSQAKKAIAIHDADPNQYDGINNANTGKTTSIIGIILGAISLLWLIYTMSTGEWDIMIEQYQEMIEEQM